MRKLARIPGFRQRRTRQDKMVAVECSKVVVVVINLIFMVFGIAVLALGIVFKVGWADVRDAFVDKSDDIDFNLQQAGDSLGNGAIAFGAIILALSLMGCIGACCRVRVFLAIYATLVLLILLAQVAVVIFLVVVGTTAEDKIVKALQDSMLEDGYHEDSSTDISKAWSAVFSSVKCCGVEDWKKEFNSTSLIQSKDRLPEQKTYYFPVTCCKNFNYEATLTKSIFEKPDIKECLKSQTTATAYTDGCEQKIKDAIDDNKGVLLGVGITIFLIEIVVVIMGFFLCCRHED